MNYLTKVYGLNYKQIEKLYKDGILPASVVVHSEIYDHFCKMRPFFKTDNQALLDCAFHFGYSREWCFMIVNQIKKRLNEHKINENLA
jgi:hypothetical protein